MNTHAAAPHAPNADALPAARLAYVPPKLERLDAGDTQLNLNPPFNGDDGIFYS